MDELRKYFPLFLMLLPKNLTGVYKWIFYGGFMLL